MMPNKTIQKAILAVFVFAMTSCSRVERVCQKVIAWAPVYESNPTIVGPPSQVDVNFPSIDFGEFHLPLPFPDEIVNVSVDQNESKFYIYFRYRESSKVKMVQWIISRPSASAVRDPVGAAFPKVYHPWNLVGLSKSESDSALFFGTSSPSENRLHVVSMVGGSYAPCKAYPDASLIIARGLGFGGVDLQDPVYTLDENSVIWSRKVDSHWVLSALFVREHIEAELIYWYWQPDLSDELKSAIAHGSHGADGRNKIVDYLSDFIRPMELPSVPPEDLGPSSEGLE